MPEAGEELYADDVVVEWPFNPPERRRAQGAAEVRDLIRAGRSALPVRFDRCEATVHETADPEVVIAEYELSGTVTTTGRTATASFVMVLRVRDGKIVHCREYQDLLAITAALAPPPEPDAD